MCLLLSNGWVCGQRFGFEAFFEACSFFTIEHRRWRVANGDYLAFGRLPARVRRQFWCVSMMLGLVLRSVSLGLA